MQSQHVFVNPIRSRRGSAAFEGLTEALRGLDGFDGGYLLTDRGSGKALTITLWSSEDAVRASTERAKQMRSGAAQGAGLKVDSVGTYEVTVQIQPGA